jgi:hypothetical protein
MKRMPSAFLVLALSTGQALAQTGLAPDPWGFNPVDATGGLLAVDQQAEEARAAIIEKFEILRAAGYPMPSVTDMTAYNRTTLVEANRLFLTADNSCTTAVDLAMFLDAHIEDTNLADALGTLDRPLWMARKVAATMILPDKVGLSTEVIDRLLGLKNRFSWIGFANNVWESSKTVDQHWDDTARVQHGKWAQDVYVEARRENWDEEDIGLELLNLQAQSDRLLAEVNAHSAAFDAAVTAEEARHEAHMAELDRIYADRLDRIAKDEAEGAERKRREQWLRDNAHTGEPKPGVGVIIDPTRNPSEMSYEWAITETEPGGKYYRQVRAAALVDLQVNRAHAKLKHESDLEALALNHGTELNDLLRDISQLQVERETLQTVNLPMVRGKCEELGKPGTLKEKMPEISLETAIQLPHDELVSVLQHLDVMPSDEVMTCICQMAGYGSPQTTQIYHPDTWGDFDARYECNHPGPPCIVAGYGCTRHPLPSNPAFWKGCAAGTTMNGVPVDQAISDALNGPAN